MFACKINKVIKLARKQPLSKPIVCRIYPIRLPNLTFNELTNADDKLFIGQTNELFASGYGVTVVVDLTYCTTQQFIFAKSKKEGVFMIPAESKCVCHPSFYRQLTFKLQDIVIPCEQLVVASEHPYNSRRIVSSFELDTRYCVLLLLRFNLFIIAFVNLYITFVFL